MNLVRLGCEDGRWMELAKDHVQWQALVLAVLNLYLREIGCVDVTGSESGPTADFGIR
jgi:hypothetical protein